MNHKATLREIYSEIRVLLFRMIPERWDSLYLYASVIDNSQNSGEMFFYFYPKSIIKKKAINVYEVPSKYNIDETEYMILAKKLYELIKRLRKECVIIDGKLWSNITISIEDVEFLAEYNYDDLKDGSYSSEERRMIWQYKYLDYPIEKLNKEQKEVLERYLDEEEMGQHINKIYSETFYQEHLHNYVEYGNESSEKIEETEKIDIEKMKQEVKPEEKKNKQVRNQLLKY